MVSSVVEQKPKAEEPKLKIVAPAPAPSIYLGLSCPRLVELGHVKKEKEKSYA
jgi:hypothetical protein